MLGAPQLKEPKGSVELKDHVDPEWPLNWQSAIKDPAIKDLQVQTRLGSLLVHDRPVVSVVRLPRLPDPVWDSKRWNDTRDTHGCMPTERTRFCDQGEPIDMSSRVVTMTDDGVHQGLGAAGAGGRH